MEAVGVQVLRYFCTRYHQIALLLAEGLKIRFLHLTINKTFRD